MGSSVPDSVVLLFRGRDATSRAVAAVGGTLLLAIVSVAVLAGVQLRSQAISVQHQRATGQSVSLTAHANQVFAAADFVLQAIQDEVHERQPRNSAELRQDFGTAKENARLLRRDESFQPISMLAIFDAEGLMVSVSRLGTTPLIKVADRDYFQLARLRSSGETIVGQAAPDPSSGKWSFYLARRLETPEGSFLGVAVASVSCEQLASLYERLRMGHETREPGITAVSLVRDDLALLARAPYDTHMLGKRLSGDGAYASLRREYSDTSIPAASTWDDERETASHVELVSRHLDKFPVSIVIATRDDYYLAGWFRQVALIALVAGITFVFFGYSFSVLFTSLRRREEALVESHRLQRLAEGASLAKSRFLATVSHEIRTPMNGILGTAELLDSSPLPAHSQRLAATLLRAGRSLLRILNDILDFSKLEAGELRLAATNFRLRPVVDEVFELFKPLAESKELELFVEVAENVPQMVTGDCDRIRQILSNLVNNALKFTAFGEVVIRVSSVETDIGKTRILFEVSDSGVGIPDEMHDKVFDFFVQADDSVERHAGGTGLGLAISRRMVDLMKGKIDFESLSEGGTRFWFELPLALAPNVRDESAPPMSPTFGAKESRTPNVAPHVLVVEDDATNAMVVEAQLARLGATCEVAIDGESAVALLRNTKFDLVLMDCMLPGLSGYDLTRAWRGVEETEGYPRTPIIALTASALASNAREAEDAGMDEFLTKPCALEPLSRLLKKYIG